MAAPTIATLPFVERPVRELLHLEVARALPSRELTGFGWTRGATVWLEAEGGEARRVDDALVLALHTADDGEALADDLELELELPGGAVTVLASAFLARWLPRLPPAPAIVLAICNPHRAALRRAAWAAGTAAPVHYALGEVASWREPGAGEAGERILLTAEAWCTI